MRSLEKILAENYLDKWVRLLWQNGYTTPEEFSEVTEDDLVELDIPDDTLRKLLQVVKLIKKEMENTQNSPNEANCFYLETLYAGSEEEMLALKYKRGIDDNSFYSWKSYNFQTTNSSGIILPNLCPVCLNPTDQTVRKVVGWSRTETSSTGITRTRKTKSETVTFIIPCCHRKEMKAYLDFWMESKGEIKFLIKNRDYANLLVRLNGQRYPHEITIQDYKKIKARQLRDTIRGIIWLLLIATFIIAMVVTGIDYFQ